MRTRIAISTCSLISNRGRTLFDLAALVDELNEVTGCRVDVVTEHGLRDRLHDTIMREAVAV
jgi:predicted nucleotidyltransferase